MYRLLLLFFIISTVWGIGLSIEPVRLGDMNRYSGEKYMLNCLRYAVQTDDIVILNIYSGEKHPSQSLNLVILDSELKDIRSEKNIQDELNVIFKPIEFESHFSDKSSIFGISKKRVTMPVDKQFIFVCFDNIFEDKSWSFNPQTRDIDMTVDIKNSSTIQFTNYDRYATFFNPFQQEAESLNTPLAIRQFTEQDFDNKVKELAASLKEINENWRFAERSGRSLIDQEFKLRDANENVFSGYTMSSIIVLVVIFISGLSQAVFIIVILKRKRII